MINNILKVSNCELSKLEDSLILIATDSDKALVMNLFPKEYYFCNSRKELIEIIHEICECGGDARTLYYPEILKEIEDEK